MIARKQPATGERTIFRLVCTLLQALVLYFAAAGSGVCEESAPAVQVREFDFKSGMSHVLFSLPQYSKVSGLDWCEKSKRFCFSAVTDSVANARLILSCNMDGSDIISHGAGTNPSWSPRGSRIVVTRSNPERGVWVIRADSTDAVLIDRYGGLAQWSPNGRRLAYVRRFDSSQRVVTYDFVEDVYRVVDAVQDTEFNTIHGLAWSADGSAALLIMAESETAAQLVKVNVEKSDDLQTLLTIEGRNDLPGMFQLTPDITILSIREPQTASVQMYSALAAAEGNQLVRQRLVGQPADYDNVGYARSADANVFFYLSTPHRP